MANMRILYIVAIKLIQKHPKEIVLQGLRVRHPLSCGGSNRERFKWINTVSNSV